MEGQFKVFYCVTRFGLRSELQGFPCEFDGGTNLIGLYLFWLVRSDSDFKSPSSVDTDNQLIRYRWFGSLELFDFKVVLF
jgi:hypothetical protein